MHACISKVQYFRIRWYANYFIQTGKARYNSPSVFKFPSCICMLFVPFNVLIFKYLVSSVSNSFISFLLSSITFSTGDYFRLIIFPFPLASLKMQYLYLMMLISLVYSLGTSAVCCRYSVLRWVFQLYLIK